MAPFPVLSIIRHRAQHLRTVAELPEPHIASLAEEAPQEAGGVTMVDAERPGEGSLATGADAVLPREHGVIVVER